MGRSLSLAIAREGKVMERAVLCWRHRCIQQLQPKRSPDKDGGVSKVWVVRPEHRVNFLKYADRVLDKAGSEAESLYGYFGIMGAGSRWLRDATVDWCLFLGREIEVGESIMEG